MFSLIRRSSQHYRGIQVIPKLDYITRKITVAEEKSDRLEDKMIHVEDEEEDFLFELAAAEAEAVTAKRRKISTTIQSETVGSKPTVEEGAYTAALRGSKSSLWQQTPNKPQGSIVNVVSAAAGAGGDACFKCGQSGHWARDCGASIVVAGRSETSIEVAEKNCPCGLGVCLVLTANTEKNRGRKFYKCPAREENGGCGFFEWSDADSGINNTNVGTQSYGVNSTFPELPCPCGAGPCLILTAKTEMNNGRQFYRCPGNQGSSCGFFKWCNDQSGTSDPPTYNSNKIPNNLNEASNNSYSVTSGSSCFKCGQSGHWANNCTNPSNPMPNLGGVARSSSYTNNNSYETNNDFSAKTGSCFKCGKNGHWANNCPTPSDSSTNMGGVGRSSSSLSSSGTCYKCGEAGHWARDCTMSQQQQQPMNMRQRY